MVCATEVYKWFKELLPFNRIDFLCSMMQLCLPSELRFIGTLLDDMNNKDYANLREAEDRSDIPNEFRQYPLQPFNGECIRKLCLSLSLLKSTNQKVGQIIYEILHIHSDYANKCVKSKDECSNEILLLYALASYHPAFTFENRYKIGKYFQRMLLNFKESDDFPNKNNSCCYDVTYREFHEIDKFQIVIKDVKVESSDANIALDIVTKHNRNLVIKKCTTFSKITQLFKKTAELNNGKRIGKLNYEINNLTRNGNFTNANISEVLEKVIKFMESSTSNDDTSLILKDFFLHLAKSCHSNYKSENRNFDSPQELRDADSSSLNKKSSLKYIFQNNNFDAKSLENNNVKVGTTTLKRSSDTDDSCSVLDNHKSAVVSVDKILKDRSYSEVVTNDTHHNHNYHQQQSQQQQQQHQKCDTDTNRNRLMGGKSHETVDSILTDSSDRTTAISDNTNYPEMNSHIPVFQYYLPHYSVLSTSKSNSSLSHFPPYSTNSLDHVSSPVPTNNNSALMRSIVPDTLILTHCPQRFLPLNPHFSPLVPVLCPLNSSVNFMPMNEMNFDMFQSHRLAPSANTSSPTVANKLVSSSSSSSSSSIPPRLQSNHQKSSTVSTTVSYPSNFNGS